MCNQDDAKKFISALEGTAIADLQSIVDFVTNFNQIEPLTPSTGKLSEAGWIYVSRRLDYD